MLIYQGLNQPPILLVENKSRCPNLINVSDEDFSMACQQHTLYKQAIGLIPNEVKQYLDVGRVKPQFLAFYGLVFNGDFFQLCENDAARFAAVFSMISRENTSPVKMQLIALLWVICRFVDQALDC